MPDQQECARDLITQSERWPLLLRIPPKTLELAVLGWLGLAWAVFIAVDVLGLLDLGMNSPNWRHLFNNRPVEWTQWFILAVAALAAAYLPGRLHPETHAMVSRFFLLLAIGLGLMLIEGAGGIRHAISSYVHRLFGTEVFGRHYRVVSDVPYFAALAAVPLYAVLGYGRYVWESVKIRFYLVSGVGLYSLAAMSSGVRTLGDLYIRFGALVDGALFGNRFPVPEGMTQARAHFLLVDGVLEESVELLAAAMMLPAILAFRGDVHRRRETGD